MVTVLIAVFSAGCADAAGWKRPFSYFADHQDLGSVLLNFAQAEGYSASLSPLVKGKVSGRFEEVDPSQFLEGMQSAFGVRWYTLGGTLYFYHSSETKKIFLSTRSGAGKLYDNLRRSHVFSPQLPATFGAAGDVIIISGPAEYLSQIQNAAAAFENTQTEQIVMKVFPLKHAWAEDMTVSSMDKNVTIPGIASILRAMVMGTPLSGSSVTQQRATVEKLGGKGLAAQGNSDNSASSSSVSMGSQAVTAGSVSIIADPRVNSVIVSDASYRMPYYEQVIRDLDKPVELVEIHAAIVDIDTDFKRDLGITFQGSKNKDNGWSVGGSSSGSTLNTSVLPTAGIVSDAGMTISTIYTHGADFFLSRIHALEENNEARMLGRPSVLTVDNIQATLENTTTYYVQVQGYQAVDLYKVEAGTVLRVTPHIIRENGETSIKLVVNVQDDQDTSTSSTTSSGVPPIKQTKINTQAIVSAGQSLLIGGYYYEEKSNDKSGVPGLMDVPVVGSLFKAKTKSTKRMERLILITPRIVNLRDTNVPLHADDPSFHRAATQADYDARVPVRQRAGGCTRRTSDQPSLEQNAGGK